jgi:hypothetical protein
MTVKSAGTYYVTVDAAFEGGSATTTYRLAVSVQRTQSYQTPASNARINSRSP